MLTFSGHNTVKIETNDLKPKSPVLWNLNIHLYDLESKKDTIRELRKYWCYKKMKTLHQNLGNVAKLVVKRNCVPLNAHI